MQLYNVLHDIHRVQVNGNFNIHINPKSYIIEISSKCTCAVYENNYEGGFRLRAVASIEGLNSPCRLTLPRSQVEPRPSHRWPVPDQPPPAAAAALRPDPNSSAAPDARLPRRVLPNRLATKPSGNIACVQQSSLFQLARLGSPATHED